MPPLVPPLIALAAGIMAGPHLAERYVWLMLAPALGLAALRPKCALLAVFLFGAGVRTWHETRPPEIPDDGYPVRVTAQLESAPEWRAPGYYLNVRILSVGEVPWRGRARLAYFPPGEEYPELEDLFRELDLGSGDRIRVLVHLRRPNVYRNPGVFDYRRYLERRGIYWTGTIRNPRLVEVAARGWHGLDRIREWATERVGAHFRHDPTVEALVLGMVLGQRRRLPPEAAREFQAAGLIHLLVVSGFNLAVVAFAAIWVGRRIPFGRWQRAGSRLFALIVVAGYAVLVEGDAPVARAALMAGLLLAGTLLDRGYAVGNVLAATAILILAAFPRSLGDSSFQLTFAAVAAILALALPWIRWMLGWIPPALRKLDNEDLDRSLSPEIADWRVARRLWCELRGVPLWVITVPWRIGLALAEAAIVTISVQAVLLPWMVESYHRVSAVSIPLNVFGALVAAAITPAGLVLPLLPRFLAGLLAWPMEAMLDALVFATRYGLELPGATTRVPSPPGAVWMLYGLALLAAAAALRRRSPVRASMAAAAVLGLGLVIVRADFSPPPVTHPTLTFIDVAQGDSVLVELPDGRRIVVDGGGVVSGGYRSLRDEGTFSIGEDVASAYLFSRGIRRLDALVLTHAHHDHMDGLFDLMANFEVGEFWLGVNPMVPAYRRLLEEVHRRNLPIRWVRAGDRIGPFRVLNPPPGRGARDRVHNDDSVVMLLEAPGGQTALLTGDLESDLAGLPEDVDVLKIPHHGSRNTRLRVGARVPVISVGANNPFGHPDPAKLPALRTDILGAIQVTLEPDGPKVAFPGL